MNPDPQTVTDYSEVDLLDSRFKLWNGKGPGLTELMSPNRLDDSQEVGGTQ